MHPPTPEQQLIIDRAKGSSGSILVNALAGAAKTTTLEMICQALPVQPILSLAFNKKIATEMEKRLPGHVKCQTLNSLGHRVWGTTVSGRLILSNDKMYTLIKEKIDGLKRTDKSEAWSRYAELKSVLSHAKSAGYIPEGKYPNARRLISTYDFWASTEEEPDEWLRETVDTILCESIGLSYKGIIEFDDQIYMPTLFGGSFPRFPLVMVDEAQDLSAINHAMLERLVTQRIIAVGDPFQSIYGFRGAVHEGMSRLQSQFKMSELGLSISFRCPIEVVKLARKRAPHMQWAEWAQPGEVHYADRWYSKDIPDGSAIICRNNAPLFSCALRLLRQGRGVQLVGSDIGPGLIKTLKSFGEAHAPQVEVLKGIDSWVAERLKKSRSKAAIYDRAECLRVFAAAGPNLGAAIAYAESIFKSTGRVFLLSGHKAKGLEWETVYHLDPWRIPSEYAFSPEAIEQEKNVEYVITTRAKQTLNHVNMEDLDVH